LDLLRQFARENSQDAFAEIVRRHLNLVYSAARRQVRSPQLAEEVAQSVFADLARDTGKLKPDTVLTAWLYSVTRRRDKPSSRISGGKCTIEIQFK
jgi:DNA-directed RNA polymerase specialized sigma24 family protein